MNFSRTYFLTHWQNRQSRFLNPFCIVPYGCYLTYFVFNFRKNGSISVFGFGNSDYGSSVLAVTVLAKS